jgi:hypothetical protein
MEYERAYEDTEAPLRKPAGDAVSWVTEVNVRCATDVGSALNHFRSWRNDTPRALSGRMSAAAGLGSGCLRACRCETVLFRLRVLSPRAGDPII